MSDSTLNMSYVNHYLNNFSYLQDNYRLDITAIVTQDILKCKECISLIAFHSHLISNPSKDWWLRCICMT